MAKTSRLDEERHAAARAEVDLLKAWIDAINEAGNMTERDIASVAAWAEVIWRDYGDILDPEIYSWTLH